MKGADLARKLKALAALVKARDEVSDDELAALLAVGLGVSGGRSELSQKRAEAGRKGGAKSAETRREANGTAQPKHAPNQPSKPPEAIASGPPEPIPEANAEAKPKQTPPVPPPPLHSPSSLPPESPKEFDAVAKDPVAPPRSEPRSKTATAATAFENHEQALEAIDQEGAVYVAELCRDDDVADRVEAHRFPFVVKVLTAFHEAKGRTGPPRICKASEAADVRAVLVVTALGYLPSDLVRVAKLLPTQEKFRNKASAAIMTPSVVAIALAELNDGDARVATLVHRARASAAEEHRGGAPQALGATLGRLAAAGGSDA